MWPSKDAEVSEEVSAMYLKHAVFPAWPAGPTATQHGNSLCVQLLCYFIKDKENTQANFHLY